MVDAIASAVPAVVQKIKSKERPPIIENESPSDEVQVVQKDLPSIDQPTPVTDPVVADHLKATVLANATIPLPPITQPKATDAPAVDTPTLGATAAVTVDTPTLGATAAAAVDTPTLGATAAAAKDKDFTNAQFPNADLRDAYLNANIYNGANFTGANLTDANLNQSDFIGANFTSANLTNTYLNQSNFTGANFTGADLSSANPALTDTYLNQSTFKNANFTNANLTSVRTNSSDFTGAQLVGTNLDHTDLMQADLSGANLTGAKLNRTKLPALVTSNPAAFGLTQAQIDTNFPPNSPARSKATKLIENLTVPDNARQRDEYIDSWTATINDPATTDASIASAFKNWNDPVRNALIGLSPTQQDNVIADALGNTPPNRAKATKIINTLTTTPTTPEGRSLKQTYIDSWTATINDPATTDASIASAFKNWNDPVHNRLIGLSPVQQDELINQALGKDPPTIDPLLNQQVSKLPIAERERSLLSQLIQQASGKDQTQ
jgi:uncharacterized protein YjbI with pentapeptide repeats